MKINRKHKIKKVLSKAPTRIGTEHAWFDSDTGTIFATDGKVAVRVHVESSADGECSGPVPMGCLDTQGDVFLGEKEATINGAACGGTVSFDRLEVPNHPAPSNCMSQMFDDAEKNTTVVKLDAKLLYNLSQALGCDRLELRIGEDEMKPVWAKPLDASGNYGIIQRIKPSFTG